MIVIDGRESSLAISNFANLEEVLIKLMEEENLEQRIVTDVFVDDEAFSELYPHQAEDIDSQSFSRLELRTISFEQMASDVVTELPKVIDIMANGSRRVAQLLRLSDIAEGLEVLQDIIAVTREMLNTIHILRSQFSSGVSRDIDALGEVLGTVLGEIGDVMDAQDWMLVADLLEYEYLPACEGWRGIINSIADDIAASSKAA